MNKVALRYVAACFFGVLLTTAVLAQPCATILISSVTPQSGPSAGGTTVTLTSANAGFYGCAPFEPPAPTVAFGGVAGTVISFTASQIVVITPPHAPGVVDVTVQAFQASGTTTQAFKFVDSSAISTLSSTILMCLAICVAAVACVRLR
jgi:hypothetical protein